MKIKLSLTFLALVITNLMNAQTASVTDGCAPLPVTFTAPAGTSPPYYWDYGNGVSSGLSTSSSTNSYNTVGTYTFVLTQGVGGAILGNKIIIHVYNKPNIQITSSASQKGCVPLNVSFSANVIPPAGVTINTYSWGFGDATGGSTGNPKSHTYNSAGVFDVTLSINTSSVTCDTTKVFPKYISTSTPPVASYVTTPNPPSACTPPLTVSFKNTSTSKLPLTYAWTGPPTTNFNQSTQTYSVNGNFPVSLTVTDTNNCSRTTTQTISIGKPTASFTMPDTVCINIPFSLVNTSSLGAAGNYLWTFDAGTNVVSPTTTNSFQPFVSFSTGGIHKVILKATSGSCSGMDTISIFVENPTVTFTSSPTYSCSEPKAFQFTGISTSSVSQWKWTFGDGKTSSVQNPNHTFAIPDSIYSKRGTSIFSNTLTITTTSGCIATYTAKDTIHLVWARFQPDTAQGCAPLTVTFYDSSKSNTPTEPIVSWNWYYGDGSTPNPEHRTNPNANPHKHTFTTPGIYNVYLIATNNKGCNDTSYSITIKVGDPTRAIDFTANPLSVCPGATIQFTNTTANKTGITGWNYQSNGEFLSHCFQDDSPSLVFDDSTGLQTITLTADYNGCLLTKTKTNYITVKGPIAHFDYLISCGISSDTVQFTDKSDSTTSVSWNFGDGTTATTGGTFTHAYSASGNYRVILTATNNTSGCAPSQDTAIIHVRKIKAQFTTVPTLCKGVPYTFNAGASTDVDSSCYRGFTWIFSDPAMRPLTSGSSKTPISFSSGEQTVGLVVQDINGCVDTLTQHIKVYNTPVLFTISDSVICIPETVQFNDISVGDTTITKWKWAFGDGGKDSIKNPIHPYNAVVGNPIAITLTITDILGCISSATKNINIYKLISAITVSPSANICVNSPITFNASDFTSQGSNLTYKWDFTDGVDSLGNNKTHIFTSAGQYIVKLYYTEKATGCNDSTTKTITVQDYPQAGFYTTPPVDSVFCSPKFVTFTDSSKVGIYSMPLSQNWDITSFGALNGSSDAQTFINSGTYSVTLTVSTTNGCKDTLVKKYLVVAPKGDFNMNITSICKGDSIRFTNDSLVDVVKYTWFFGDGDTVSNINPVSHTYNFLPPSGSTKASLIVYGQGGCAWPVEKVVQIHYVKADFTRSLTDLDTAICLGNPIFLTDSSKNANVYSWTLGDGSNSASTTSFSHKYNTTGKFNITLAVKNNAFGCTDTITKAVIVNAVPQVTAIGDSVCDNSIAHLSVTNYNPAYLYSWKDTVGLSNSHIYNPTFIATKPGNNYYYVTATIASTGCFTTDTAPVFVVAPLVGYEMDTSIVIGQYVTLPINNQSGFVQFTWTPTTGLSCLTCSNPQVQPMEDITYSAFMADILGCSSATAIFKIHIYPETFVKLPTTFTPNGDGLNDIIYVDGWGIKDLISFEIYNRWGELIFKTSELTEGWNGYYKGVLQNSDTYVYKVDATTYRDTEVAKEGHINLMR